MLNYMGVLLFKNLKGELRYWRHTLLEFFIVLIVGVTIISNMMKQQPHHTLSMNDVEYTHVYNEESLRHAVQNWQDVTRIRYRDYFLSYTPSNSKVAQLLSEKVATILDFKSVRVAGDEDDVTEDVYDTQALVGLIFHNKDINNPIPTILNYTMVIPEILPLGKNEKYFIEDVRWITKCYGMLNAVEDVQTKTRTAFFHAEVYMAVQELIFRSWYYALLNTYDESPLDKIEATSQNFYLVKIAPFRHRKSRIVCHYAGFTYLYSILNSFMFLLPFCNLIYKISKEVKEGIILTFWRYNCPCKAHWITHFITSLLHLLVLDVFFMMIVMVPWIRSVAIESFIDTNPGLFLVFFIFYNMGLILMAFTISILFVEPFNAVLVGICSWLFFYIFFFAFLNYDRYLDRTAVGLIIPLYFNNAMAYVLHYLKYHNWEEEQYYISYLFLHQITNILIELLLFVGVWYVMPMQNFDGKPFHIAHYLERRKRKRKPDRRGLTLPMDFPSWRNFESFTGLQRPLLQCKNIFLFKNHPTIPFLSNVSISAYPNEITVLLGHHGSGKTSLLKLFAGLLTPYYGSVLYEGNNIAEEFPRRALIADILFLQHPLFDRLTIRENLDLYIFIKGNDYSKSEKVEEAEKWLRVLASLVPDPKTTVSKLTFGQKRFLSLCCIMCCNTKIVLLDDPTNHMELNEQLEFWRILNEEKAGRAIVVTTPRSDEAQAIADRIGILNHGVVLAMGSIFFFRSRLNTEMQIILIKHANYDVSEITNFFQKHMSLVKFEYEVGNSLIYSVPTNQRPKLQGLLIQLENAADALGIASIHALDLEGSEVINNIDLRIKKKVKPLQVPEIKGSSKTISSKTTRWNQVRAMNYKKLMQRYLFVMPFMALPIVTFTTLIIRLLVTILTYQGVVELHENDLQMHVAFNDIDKLAEEFLTRRCNHYRLEPKDVYFPIRELVFDESSVQCVSESAAKIFETTKEHYNFGAVEFQYRAAKKSFEAILYINIRNIYSGPILLNMFHNLMLKRTFGKAYNFSHWFKIDPVEVSLDAVLNFRDHDITSYEVSLTVGLLFPFIISYFIIFVVEDKIKVIQTLLDIAGLKKTTYWSITFLWDYIVYTILCLGFYLTLSLMEIDFFRDFNISLIFLLLMLYGLNTLPVVYIISLFCGKSIKKSYIISVLTLYCIGTMPFVIFWEVLGKSDTFYWTFCFLPSFAIIDGFNDLYTKSVMTNLCEKLCFDPCELVEICEFVPECCGVENFFSFGKFGILSPIVACFFNTSFYMFVLIWITVRRDVMKHHLSESVKLYRTVYYDYFDPNVIKIKKDIAKMVLTSCLQVTVIVDQLEKEIPRFRKKLNTTSFEVRRGECLCIYGPCKSGKTHLARQLVGDIGFQFGEIYMVGTDFKENLPKVRKVLGYCPQRDALFRFLTLRQNLKIFCMVRGIPKEATGPLMRSLSVLFDFSHCLHKYPGDVTHAIRRKLNLAIACIANNEVIVLDEPTAGLPADQKEDIWRAIRYLCGTGVAVILCTSDSLECKKCGNRVIIFDQYDMLSYDNLYAIRSYHSKGFIIEAKVFREGATEKESDDLLTRDMRNLRRFIRFLDDNSVEIKNIANYAKFYVPIADCRYSYLYGILEKNKHRLNLSEYYIQYASIEDILLKITNERAAYKAETEAYKMRQKHAQQHFRAAV